MGIGDRMNDLKLKETNSPCNTCARMQTPFKCEAFDDIPMVFLAGDNDHRKPYFGDNGLQYLAETK